MTLAVPTTRSSLLRPLTESLELYENPDTPGTSYSFQEQGSSRSMMQVESAHHLAPPMLDANMLMSTDDEMIDSDSDQRRDDDFDIDIDAEVYSANGGDLEIVMTMEEDSVAYGHAEPEVDNDDIMLDNDPVDYSNHNFDVPQSNQDVTQPDATQPDATQPDSSFSTHPALSGHDASFFQQSSPPPPGDHEHQETRISSEQISSQPDTEAQPSVEEVDLSALQPEQPAASGHESVDVEQQRRSSESHEEPPAETSVAFDEENDSTQSSTTLTHEVVGQEHFAEDRSRLRAEHPEILAESQYPQPNYIDPTQGEEPYDSSYQHPVIVQYEQNQLTLFPSMADWSVDPVLANVYSDLPSDYLLPDVGVCEKPLDELFAHLREILGPSVGQGSELIVEIELLGLKIGEDNAACKSVSLRRILDMHNQLHENDGYDIPMPVNMSLYAVPRFYSRLEEISAALQERKGLQECLSLLGLPSVDYYENEEDMSGHELDVADHNEAQTISDGTQNDVNEAPKDDAHESLEEDRQQQQEAVEGLFDPQVDEQTTIPETTEQSTIPETDEPGALDLGDVGRHSALEASGDHADDASVASSPHEEVPLEQSVAENPVRAASLPVDEEEEELLEYEDEQGDNAADATQPESVVHPQEAESVAEENAEGELLEAADEPESYPDHLDEHVSPVQPSIADHNGAEEHADAAASTVAQEQAHPVAPAVAEEQADPAASTVAKEQPHTAASTAIDSDSALPNVDDSSAEPSPIPVFDGGDEEEEGEGEYDDQHNHLEGYGYDQEGPYQGAHEGAEDDCQNTEQNFDHAQEEAEDDEDYEKGHFHGADSSVEEHQYGESDNQEIDDYDDYFDEELEYIEEEEIEYIQREAGDYELEEYDESLFENGAAGDVEVIDPSITDAIDVVTGSPVASADEEEEEELIDYEDDEDDGPPHSGSTSAMSPSSLKRLRDESDQGGDGELDANQASKRARAE